MALPWRPHYAEVFSTTRQYIINTLLHAGIAACLDVAIGIAISYVVILVVDLTIRRLPYVRPAGLHQVSLSLEEAAENVDASKMTTVRRIVAPLMTGGIVAGFVTSFATARLELPVDAGVAGGQDTVVFRPQSVQINGDLRPPVAPPGPLFFPGPLPISGSCVPIGVPLYCTLY